MSILMTNPQMTDSDGFRVVHPLDDVAEQKRSPAGLGEMPMSGSVKVALYALRGYLILIGLMVGYRVMVLAGIISHHLH